MSFVVHRLPPGQVIARVSFEPCLLPRPRRALPADIAQWARALPVPARLARFGLAGPLREAVAPLWAAWLARFRQGLRIEREGEGDDRVVVHCDTVRYRVTARGKVHAFCPTLQGDYEACAVEVGNPFFSWAWVRTLAEREVEAVAPLYQSVLVRELAGMLPEDCDAADIIRECNQWLSPIIVGLARRCVDGVRIRALLRDALALDPELLAAARRTRTGVRDKHGVSSGWWNCCVDYAEPLKELQRIAPGLLPLFGMLMAGRKVNPYRLDLREVRERLTKQGLSPDDWKRLLAKPARPVWQMYFDGVIQGAGALHGFLVGWAKLHRGLPDGLWMPRALFEPLARTYVGPHADNALPPLRWPGTPVATREAILSYRKARCEGRGHDFVESEWGRVVRWAGNYETQGERAPVRHWSTARRRAEQHERMITASLAGQRWTVPLAQFEDCGLMAVALTTGEQLAEEAIAMRHCADRFVSDCAAGKLVVYSVRRSLTGQRVATASISIAPIGARLCEISRSLNREPSAQEKEFGASLARRVNVALSPAMPGYPRPRSTQHHPGQSQGA